MIKREVKQVSLAALNNALVVHECVMMNCAASWCTLRRKPRTIHNDF